MFKLINFNDVGGNYKVADADGAFICGKKLRQFYDVNDTADLNVVITEHKRANALPIKLDAENEHHIVIEGESVRLPIPTFTILASAVKNLPVFYVSIVAEECQMES